MKLDVLIINGEVYDGVNTEPNSLSIGIKDGRIAYLGEKITTSSAAKKIDAKGSLVSPGFIDTHASEGFSYLRDNAADHKLRQGVTTELFGNCGTSPAPILDYLRTESATLAKKIGFSLDWVYLDEYFRLIKQRGVPINTATLIGHSTLRGGIVQDPLTITDSEIGQMERELNRAMRQGAFGLSTGLIYSPGCYADSDEIIRLAKVASHHSGVYASHIRNERDDLESAVDEALNIGEKSNLPVLISHLKAAEKRNWGKIPKVLEKIESYLQHHPRQAAVDVYPYTAVSTKLRSFLPAEILAEGSEALPEKLANPECRLKCLEGILQRGTDFSQLMLISSNRHHISLKSIDELAARQSIKPNEFSINLLQKNPDTWIVYNCLSKADLDAAILWKNSMICSDSWSYPVNAKTHIGDPHPRTFGAFSRFLNDYVFSESKLNYGEAVTKMTSTSADFIGLKNRGRIEKGCFADIAILNPKTFKDKATYAEPRQFAEGIDYVLINGRMAVDEGEIVNRSSGTVLTHGKH